MDYPNRKATRIKDYDYSTPGVYFITVCTKDKQQILSHIVRGEQDYREIWQYIDTNPQKWTQDCFYEVTT